MLLCAIVFIGLDTTVFTVRERDYSTGEVSNVSFKDTIGIIIKNRNFILYLFGMMFFFIGFNNLRAIMNYYVEDIMGYGKKEITIASALLFGAAAICFYPTNKLSKKYGYRKIMLCCLAMLIVTTSMLFFLGKIFPVNFGFVLFALIGIPLGVTHISNLDMNIGMKFRDFAEVSFMKMDFAGLFSGANMVETIFTVTMLVISFSLVNMFDSIGTLLGAAKQSGMIDENGEVIRMKQALMSDAISTAAGAMVGTSTVTTVVESSAGIAAGGRTGLTSLVTALMFLGAILFAPIVSIVPAAATAPALIFVGILMLGNIRDVDFSDMSNALPAFCTIVFMPFTYSIANGVAFGLIIS